MEKLAQGAEAIVYRDGDKVVKHRFSKQYRHPQLDKSLRQFRTRREGKVISKLNDAGIGSPILHSVNDKEMKVEMSFVPGSLLSDVVENDAEGYGTKLGALLGRLHALDIIHGDITTSNVIDVDGELHFIDFGLSSFSMKVEDKSVELRLLLRALESRHPEVANDVFMALLQSYIAVYPAGREVVDRYQTKVSKRGRHAQK